MTKVQALNALDVIDSSCCGGECEYVFAEISAANTKVLMDAGFTLEQIDEAIVDDETAIDLSILAFQYADVDWWSSKGGFDENVYTCSVCGGPWVLIDGTPPENNMNFCPNCGARMEGKPCG